MFGSLLPVGMTLGRPGWHRFPPPKSPTRLFYRGPPFGFRSFPCVDSQTGSTLVVGIPRDRLALLFVPLLAGVSEAFIELGLGSLADLQQYPSPRYSDNRSVRYRIFNSRKGISGRGEEASSLTENESS